MEAVASMEEVEVDRLAQVLDSVMQAMSTAVGPAKLWGRLRFELEDRRVTADVDGALEFIRAEITSDNPNSLIHSVFARHLRTWDAVAEAAWTESTYRLTSDRRFVICDKLDLGKDVTSSLLAVAPIAKSFDDAVLIAADHQNWYTEQRRLRTKSFYWDQFKSYLQAHGRWPETAISSLHESTDKVIRCLSDPERMEAFQTRGLVVGYVQSGKTANFTALIAKAMDAGYRLIVILAGTLDNLRLQTQRRLDKELVGKEQIVRDAEDGQAHEYEGDQDWNSFAEYGALPSVMGRYDIRRITTSRHDFRKLGPGRDVLRFERKYADRSLNAPENLHAAAAKLVVVKKHPAVIRKLIADFKGLKVSLDDIPVLVIDDESDQASVNTVDPKKKSRDGKEKKERTSTNRAIVDLLALFVRSQYVGYTATPAANTLINPGDALDLFPRDFIELLPRPESYMGVSDFHDFDDDFNPLSEEEIERLGFRSKQKCFVRKISNEHEEEMLKSAIDAFFLAGAVKLFRHAKDGGAVSIRHHTMLVHRATQQVAHEVDAERIRTLYIENAYRKQSSMERIWRLWKDDFEPVSEVQESQLVRPGSLEELSPYLQEAFERFEGAKKQVLVVNGQEAHRDDMPDFDKEEVWNILVGGAKLSRGYTVEGLTTTFFLRKAAAADTLMQMGRWFGFRRGYRDLVRLYIGATVASGKNHTVDLYEMFESICMDEERFRKRIAVYSREGIRPIHVPPLVPMGMLLPTQRNKMHNAQIQMENFGGDSAESGRVTFDSKCRISNIAALRNLLSPSEVGRSVHFSGHAAGVRHSLAGVSYRAPPERILGFLGSYRWGTAESQFSSVLGFLSGVGEESPEIESWLVIVLGKPSGVAWTFLDGSHGVFARAVVGDRFKVFSELRHRMIASDLAGIVELTDCNAELLAARRPRQAVCLIYPTVSKEFLREDVRDEDVTLGLSLVFPKNAIPQRINWRVIDPKNPVAFVLRGAVGEEEDSVN